MIAKFDANYGTRQTDTARQQFEAPLRSTAYLDYSIPVRFQLDQRARPIPQRVPRLAVADVFALGSCGREGIRGRVPL
jgi:hypothetical protein